MATGTFARRRGASEDEIKLVDADAEKDEEERVDSPNETGLTLSIDEEKHHVPFPLSIKQRLERVRRLKSERSKRLCWLITILVLGILVVLAVSVPLGLWSKVPKESCLDFEDVPQEEYEEFPYLYFPKTGEIDLCHKGDTKLAGTLGVNHDLVRTIKVDNYDYTHDTSLKLSRPPDDNFNCLRIEWTGTSSIDNPLRDCYKIEGTLWYGGYETYNQRWPIHHDRPSMTPFLPHDYLRNNVSHPERFGPVLHPIWVSSNGTGFLVDEGVPLHVSISESDDEICLQALPYELECVPHSSNYTSLTYTICVYEDIKDTWNYFLSQIERQMSSPDERLLRDPIWSTWAEYKTSINFDTLNSFFNNITAHGFNISQLEIDDGYSMEYGELSFDEDKFPESDIRELSRKVPLTAWVHPFVNPHATEFMKYLNVTNYFLPGGDGNSVCLVSWWHDYGAVIDFLNDDVINQHQVHLELFRDRYNLTSFKFDAGEVTYLPECVPPVKHFADFTVKYASFVANQTYAPRAEVRVGYFTQNLPLFVRILDRDSTWSSANGLRSIIPTVLSLGIAGYSYVIPDMIGGNGVAADIGSESTLSEELYVRWAQLNTFLPVMQFSIVPWRYSDDVISHVLSLTKFHWELVDIMLSDPNLPIVKPLWWVSDDLGEEERSLWEKYVNEEFVIGSGSDTLLVAPVLNERGAADEQHCPQAGSTSRTVYFPKGFWERQYPPWNMPPEARSTHRDTFTFCVGLYDFLYFKRCHDCT